MAEKRSELGLSREERGLKGRSQDVFDLLSSHPETNPSASQPKRGSDSEWVIDQEQTFIVWLNQTLAGSDYTKQMTDLRQDLSDGLALIHLVKVFSPESIRFLKYHAKPRLRLLMLENVQIAFDCMKRCGIKLVNVAPADIVDGNLKLILGLLQQMMNRFGGLGGAADMCAEELQQDHQFHQMALLAWLQALLTDLSITNLSTDWADGRALSTLINIIDPELIPDHASLDPSEAVTNIQEAIRIAKESLGIKQVIVPEDLATKNPNQDKVVTYLSQFCSEGSCGYQFMLDWVNSILPKHRISNFASDWEDGLALCALTEVYVPTAGLDPGTLAVFGPFDRVHLAMESAERELDIRPLLKPEAFVSRKTNELLRMAYLTQFINARHRSPGLSPADSPLPISKVAPEIHSEAVVHAKPFESGADFVDVEPFTETQPRFELKVQDVDKDAEKEEQQREREMQEELERQKQLERQKELERQEELERERELEIQRKRELEREKMSQRIAEISKDERPKRREDRWSALDDIFSAIEDEINFDQVLKDLDDFSTPVTPRTLTKSSSGTTPSVTEMPVPEDSHMNNQAINQDLTVESDVFSPSHTDGSTSPKSVTEKVIETVEVIQEEAVVESGVDAFRTSTSSEPSSDRSSRHRSGSPPKTPCSLDDMTPEPEDHTTKRKRKHRDSIRTHPELCTASGKGLYSGAVGQPSQFTVNCSRGGQGRLDITVLSPSGNNIEASGKPVGDGVFELFFIPDTVGPHKIQIQFNDQDIPLSPFESQVCDPSACIALGDGLSRSVVGVDTEFEILCQNAGSVTISTSVSGPAKPVSYKLIERSESGYTYSYRLSEPGEYLIDAKCQGFPIRGSPFRIVAEYPTEEADMPTNEGVPNVSLCFVQDPPGKYVQVGEEISFKVDCTRAGLGSLLATVAGPFGENRCRVAQLSQGLYRVTFHPQVVGTYAMHLLFSDQELTSSPLRFSISNPRNILLHVDDIVDKAHTVGETISFVADTQHCGEGELTAQATCPSGKSNVNVTANGNRSTITYTFEVPGLHSIYIFFNGLAIESSPVELTAVVDTSNSTGIGVNIDDMVLTKSIPVSGGYRLLNKLLEFQVYSPHQDFSPLSVSAVGTRTGVKPYTNIVPTSDNMCNVQFKATEPDDYRVSVLYNGKNLSGSPFTVPIRVSQPNKVTMCDPVIPLSGKDPLELVFDVSNAGDGILQASIVNSNKMTVPSKIVQSADGIYRVIFEPIMNNTFFATITFAGKHILGSPFKVMYEEQGETPPVVIEFEPEMDERGLMGAAIFGRKTGRQDAQVQQYQRGKYQISFQPEKPDIFDIHCYWFEKEIPGSPFEIDLSRPEGESREAVIESVPIAVGGKVGLLSAGVVGRKNGWMPVKLTSLDDCLCNIEFSAESQDTFDLHVYWNGQILHGTPIPLDVH